MRLSQTISLPMSISPVFPVFPRRAATHEKKIRSVKIVMYIYIKENKET